MSINKHESNQKKHSITLLGPYPPPYGGVSTHIKRLYIILQKLNIPVIWYCQEKEPENKDPNIIPVRPKWTWKRWIIKYGWRCKTTIFHNHGGWYWSPAAWFMSLLGKKVIMTFHDQMTLERLASTPRMERLFAEKLIKNGRVSWIAVSNEVKRQLASLGITEERISVIPAYLPQEDSSISEPLPASMQEFINNHHPVLSVYGWKLTFDSNKTDLYGFDLCIDLIGKIKNDFPTVGLLVCIPYISDAEYFTLLQNRARDLAITDNLYYLTQPVSNGMAIWKNCDLFLRPTSTDGDANSVREALALNIPVVASDASPRPDGVLLFRSRNIEDLERAVRLSLKITKTKNQEVESSAGSENDFLGSLLKLYSI